MRILLMVALLLFCWLRVGEAQVHDGPHKFGKSIVNTPQGIGQKCEIPNCPEIKMVPVRKMAPVPTEEDKEKAPVPVPAPAPIPRPAFVPAAPNPGGLPGWQKADEKERFFFGKKRPPKGDKAPVDPETLDPDAPLRQPNRDAGKEGYVPWFAKPRNGNRLQGPPQLPSFPPSQVPPVLDPLPGTGNVPSFAPRPLEGRPANPFLTPPFISPTPVPPRRYQHSVPVGRPVFWTCAAWPLRPGSLGRGCPPYLSTRAMPPSELRFCWPVDRIWCCKRRRAWKIPQPWQRKVWPC